MNAREKLRAVYTGVVAAFSFFAARCSSVERRSKTRRGLLN
jgi:hypothetical protein